MLEKEELEQMQDTILGYLTAEDVFQRIKNNWENK